MRYSDGSTGQRRRSQVVRQRTANPLFGGSNPPGASSPIPPRRESWDLRSIGHWHDDGDSVVIVRADVVGAWRNLAIRDGLKIHCPKGHAGSSPAAPTIARTHQFTPPLWIPPHSVLAEKDLDAGRGAPRFAEQILRRHPYGRRRV